MKVCIKCNKERPLDYYFYHKGTKDNLTTECKACQNARARKARRDKPEQAMLGRARRRARDKGIEFSITIDDIKIPDVCPVLGIRLEIGDGKKSPNSPSLDRIDSTKGYTSDNILVVSNRANELKKDATLEELKRLANFYEILLT